jgi:hypothetical protein
MQVFDASSMIHAWDNYPFEQFPGLWDWIAEEVKASRLVIPRPILDEINHRTPECAVWLKQNSVELVAITDAILQEAFRIKKLIGIEDDNYHPKGVDENDLFVIATAKILSADVISNEGRQSKPDEPRKVKIPAVCAMSEVSLTCVNFLEYLKRGGAVFR